MNTAPNDPVILLSWVNTMLRDKYPSLNELCSSEDLDKKKLEEKLLSIGYIYDSLLNQFR